MKNSETFYVDTVVIGAGVVGLAVARELAIQGHEVIVLEAGPRFGEGVSSRNSEVIHAGIYYPANSLKARLCIEGRKALYDFCETRQLPHRRCGKWIVARGDEVERLQGIRDQAQRNGVPLEWVGQEALKGRLPDVKVDAALLSPETGIVDSHALMLALLGELESAGGQLVRQAPVVRVSSDSDGHNLKVAGASPCLLKAQQVINAAGLDAVNLARRWEAMPEGAVPQSYYARGVYFTYSGRHPFNSLIYPVPEPGGLGIHLTLDMAGQIRFGPDVEWVDKPDFTVDPARAQAFAESVQKWWPRLDASRLQPAYAGVRPKIAGPEAGFTDFRIDGEECHGLRGVVQLYGIESPGLTASLAIAKEVAEKLAAAD